MNDTTVTQPGTVALEPPSTVLNPETVSGISGGGQPSLSDPDKGNSIQSVLEGELSRLREEDAKAPKQDETSEKSDEKPKAEKEARQDDDKKPEKAEKSDEKPAKTRSDDGKFAKAEKAEEADEAKAEKGAPEKAATERSAPDDNRQSEGRKFAEPPARFLPEARTKWANVPQEVKAEFHRVSQEMETELTQSKTARERYEPIRQFDEIARQNGRDLKDSLAKVIQIEQHIARDPIGAIETILREIGPRKQDGSPVSLYEVAQVVMQRGPQSSAQAMPRQMADDPKVSAIEQELNALKTQLATAKVTPIIEKFASEHSDYQALEPQIEAVLKSGVIDQIYGSGLSLDQKLAEAYRMAGGSMPPSRSGLESDPAHSAATPAPSQDDDKKPSIDAGTKSIKGAPSDGMDTVIEEQSQDLRDILKKEFRKMSA
ncbi:MAG: hypothetical protein NBV76_05275 [Candidatus Ochrobactrum gambitense]|nr:MAG: hypothetical protein NBV76_05275 [Candidatus Ochrobactrum gambitense]WEK17217.1 MAG: hypothetical protein P0Y54_05685 [Candidatus Ochrobactrum gambitense]